MAADDKKSKTERVSPKEKPAAASKDKTAADAKPEVKIKDKSEDKTKDTSEAKTEANAEVKTENKPEAAPSKYHRGEGQKPVSQAYKDNWNAIYAKKKKKR